MEFTLSVLKDLGILAAVGSAVGAIVKLWFSSNAQRRIVNKAVLAEIKSLLIVLRRHRSWWEGDKNKQDAPLVPFMFPVFSEHLKKVGQLDGAVVSPAVQFYGYLRFLNKLQRTRPKYSPDRFKDFDSTYTSSLKNCEDRFADKFEAAFARYDIS